MSNKQGLQKRKLNTKQAREFFEKRAIQVEQAELTEFSLAHYLCGQPDEDLISENQMINYAETRLSELPDEMAGVVAAIRKARAVRLAKFN